MEQTPSRTERNTLTKLPYLLLIMNEGGGIDVDCSSLSFDVTDIVRKYSLCLRKNILSMSLLMLTCNDNELELDVICAIGVGG